MLAVMLKIELFEQARKCRGVCRGGGGGGGFTGLTDFTHDGLTSSLLETLFNVVAKFSRRVNV